MQAEERGEPLWEEEEVRPRQNRLQVWPELTILERRDSLLFSFRGTETLFSMENHRTDTMNSI